MTVPKYYSGKGEDILKKMIKPLFVDSNQYDRVSAYYNPKSLMVLLQEFSNIWKKGNRIRLIIGFHEDLKISPALQKNINIKDSIKNAVANAILGSIEDLRNIIKNQNEDLFQVIRELLINDAIHVRLVTPKINLEYYMENKKWPKPEIGLFHSKFLIIYYNNKNIDLEYYVSAAEKLKKGCNFSVVCGTFNESIGGYGNNIEDAVLFQSENETEIKIASHFVDRFEELWIDGAEDVTTMPFDSEFKSILTKIIADDNQDFDRWFNWKNYLKIVTNSPGYSGLFQPKIGLLPHQLRVYRDALSRWPIRVLLADEVGLGKTIEAGSIIRYMIKYCKLNRVVVFAPASLRYQWQNELFSLFNLKFWVYNSDNGECEFKDEKITVGNEPLSGPGNVIISWHWARMHIKNDKTRFCNQELPDLLIVDEAHHARRKLNFKNDETETQLFSLINILKDKIPHILLLTATPFQTSQLDYYSLLQLLGLPRWFNEQELENFSKWTRGQIIDNYNFKINQIRQVQETIKDFNKNNDLNLETLYNMDVSKYTEIYESYFRENGEISKIQYLENHPTSLLTLRNTRTSLKKMGYHFPKVHLSGPEIYISEAQEEWFEDLENYIKNRLGDSEYVIKSKIGIGRLRSLYRQRMVSSIAAAKDSLENRLNMLGNIIKYNEKDLINSKIGSDFLDEDYDIDIIEMENFKEERNINEIENQNKWTKDEIYNLRRLIDELNYLFSKDEIVVDPKMERLKEIVLEHLKLGRKIIIFSRFTSTTQIIVENLKNIDKNILLGRYDGEVVGIYSYENDKLKLKECDKRDIIRYLQNGIIKILICSDAASEGLNLHSANVAINVDIPWNPSRLLQRFGRVDRLGQTANDVFLINMYYPNSIEERMYSVLEDRRIDFRSVLGEVPDIMSEQHKRLIEMLSGESSYINISYEDIRKARQIFNENQYKHLIYSDNNEIKSLSFEQMFISSIKKRAKLMNLNVSEISEKTIELNGELISVDPVSTYFKIINSEYWLRFENLHKEKGLTYTIHAILSVEMPLAFVIKYENRLIPLDSGSWKYIFDFIFLGKSIDITNLPKYGMDNLCEIIDYLQKKDKWIWPDHYCITSISNIFDERPKYENLKLGKSLGLINIRT
jgi:ERCC4-related helicase